MRCWPAYDARAREKLDGAEVVHPVALRSEEYAAQLRQFYGSAHLAAFGDSDFHGLGPIGACRTWVLRAKPRNRACLARSAPDGPWYSTVGELMAIRS
jgi:hypothetical protein